VLATSDDLYPKYTVLSTFAMAIVVGVMFILNPSYGFGNGVKVQTGFGSKGLIW
jgi:hypothetical protein